MAIITDAELAQRFIDLAEAARELYYAAHWYPDRECEAIRLWTNLRDCAGIAPGNTKAVLGEPRGPLVNGPTT